MQNKKDVIASILLIVVGVLTALWSIRLRLGTPAKPAPGFFPFLVGFGIVALSIILLIQAWFGRDKGSPKTSGDDWRKLAILVAGLVIYAGILEPLGYVLSTIFMATVTMRVVGLTSWKKISMVSLVLPIGVYFLFTRVLGVELPAGVLPF